MENKTRCKGLDKAGMQRLSEMIGKPIKPWSELDESLSSISVMISFPGNSSGAKSGQNVDRPILYWSYGTGGIEFIAEEEWRLRYAMHHPEESGLTWRWFSETYPSLWRHMQSYFVDDPESESGIEPLGLDEVFDVRMVPGFDEGDFPPWVISDVECPISEEIRHRYGQRLSSVLNGPYVYFPPEKKQSIFRALRKEGWRILKQPPI